MAVAGSDRQLRSTRRNVGIKPQETPTPREIMSITTVTEPVTQRVKQQVRPPPAPNSVDAAVKKIISGSKLPSISASGLKLLRQKQAKLRRSSIAAKTLPALSDALRHALRSTLIFAQYEAGTAVCIDAQGWILTCAHCFGDDEAEIRANMPARRWLLQETGTAVLVECRAWDVQRDLALLKAIAVEMEAADVGTHGTELLSFPYISVSTNTRMQREWVACIGQPGAEDLESTTARKTLYNLFEVSWGRLRGLIPNIDPQDNLEIGTLKHDAWTYWGHSGAPLVREDDGTLVGLHSSWDDQTAMRHAVPLVAIQEFLRERLLAAKGAEASTERV